MAPSLFVLFGVFLNLLFAVPPTFAEGPERARDMGIIFEGKTGRYNAITDVNGVTVGHATVVSADTGPNAARTGVTVVFPGGSGTDERYPAATHVLNGNGEMTGTVWVAESGFLEG